MWESIATAAEGILQVCTNVIGFIVDTPVLLAFLAVTFVGIGISVFRRLRGSISNR